MIASLSGVLVAKSPPEVILDVVGVGYLIDVPMSTLYELPEVGESARLLTHLVVREDAMRLYGFYTEAELRMFQRLIKVNGIGAKVALNILSAISAGDLVQAIIKDDASRLIKIPGIGKKTAERLILDLRDRVADWQLEGDLGISGVQAQPPLDAQSDAISALVALGYKPAEAEKVVTSVNADGLTEEQLIRAALQSMHGV